ncbi:hypothetical protein C8Q79DRAFT_1011965 [Trametes meyenii]|nr:hypothetical protein C8Q79DRAFT_1011965 [Trametes meyenii]
MTVSQIALPPIQSPPPLEIPALTQAHATPAHSSDISREPIPRPPRPRQSSRRLLPILIFVDVRALSASTCSFQNYADYFKCNATKDEWITKWGEQSESGTFPAARFAFVIKHTHFPSCVLLSPLSSALLHPHSSPDAKASPARTASSKRVSIRRSALGTDADGLDASEPQPEHVQGGDKSTLPHTPSEDNSEIPVQIKPRWLVKLLELLLNTSTLEAKPGATASEDKPTIDPQYVLDAGLEEYDRRELEKAISKGKGKDTGIAAAVVSSVVSREKPKSKPKWNGRGRGPQKPAGVCWTCGGKGHRQDQYPSPKLSADKGNGGKDAAQKPAAGAANLVSTARIEELAELKSTPPAIPTPGTMPGRRLDLTEQSNDSMPSFQTISDMTDGSDTGAEDEPTDSAPVPLTMPERFLYVNEWLSNATAVLTPAAAHVGDERQLTSPTSPRAPPTPSKSGPSRPPVATYVTPYLWFLTGPGLYLLPSFTRSPYLAYPHSCIP